MQSFKGRNTLVTQIQDTQLEYDFHPYLVREGNLTYNSLTNETVRGIHLPEDKEELIRRWFMVPKNMDLNSLLYYLKQVRSVNNNTNLRDYTIFTTMKCNAACPYCFQHGGKDASMSEKVALDVANYIIKHSDKKDTIKLRWFGGEPLVNKEVISLITSKLKEAEIIFISHMSTNGELFDKVSDEELKLWNLKVVQVTLDNYASEYDKIKGLPSGAYERLKKNIRRLTDLGILFNVRVHYHPEKGIEPVLKIIEDFREFKNIRMYGAMLYDILHTPKDYEILYELEDEMIKAGLIRYDIQTGPSVHYCMADNDNACCIRVDGTLTPCEHFSEGETIGSIYSNKVDRDILQKWRSKRKYKNDCITCPIYPSCNILTNCPSIGNCEDGYRDFLIKRIKRALRIIGGPNEQRKSNSDSLS